MYQKIYISRQDAVVPVSSHSKMMKDAANAFRSDKCLDVLKEISGKLETALKEHTEESIIKEFEGKNLKERYEQEKNHLDYWG